MTVFSPVQDARVARRSIARRMYQAVQFCMEPLEARALLSGTLSYTVPDASTHALSLSLMQVNAIPTIQVTDNGAVVAQQSLASTSSVMVMGGAGNDTLIVDFAGGSPVPTGGLTFSGGGAGNSLVLQNGSFSSETYTPSGPTGGAITLDSANITYANIGGISDLAPATNATFFTTAADGPVNVVNGPGQTLEVNDAGTGAFVTTDLANKTNLTVDTNGGNDTVLLDLPQAPAGISTLFLNSDTGADTFTVQATPAGVSTTINGVNPGNWANGPDQVTVGDNGSVQNILGPVDISDDAYVVDIVIDDSADPLSQTVTYSSSAVVGLAPAAITYNQSAIDSITVNLGSGANTLTVAGTVFGSVNTINTGTGTDSVFVHCVSGGSTLNIMGQGGSDFVSVAFAVQTAGTEAGFSNILGTINVDNTGGSTDLRIDTTSESSAQTITANANAVTVATTVPQGATSATIGYGAGVSSLTITTGSGADTFNVSPSASLAFNIDAGDPSTTPGDTLNVDLTGVTGASFGPATQSGFQYAYSFLSARSINFKDVETWTQVAGASASADVAVSFTAPASVNENGAITYSYTVSNLGPNDATNVVLTDVLPTGVTYQSATGGTVSLVNGVLSLNLGVLPNGGSISGTITLLAGDEGAAVSNTASISSNVADPQTGNNAKTVSTSVVDAPLIISGGLVVAAVEGSSSSALALATFTDPGGAEPLTDYSATIAWGDGSTSAGTVSYDPATGIFTVLGNHAYAEDGTYTTSVTVNHDALAPATVTSTVNVSDAAVVASNGTTLAGVEGTAASLSLATFTDPGGAEPLADYSATINWGDGTTSPGTITFDPATSTFSVAGRHAYGEEGTFTAVVLIKHDAAPTTLVTDQINVSDPSVNLTGGLSLTAAQGASFAPAAFATFTDPGGAEPLADYAATINWGDGTSGAGTITFDASTGKFAVSGTHTYASAGSYTIGITVHHDASVDVSASDSIVVGTQPPAFGNVSITSPINEGGTAHLTGTISDTTAGGAMKLVINWGPGQGTSTYNLPAGTKTFDYTHLYRDNPAAPATSFAVSLSATNAGGTTIAGTNIVVNNLAPVASPIVGPSAGVRGQTLGFTDNFTDAGVLDSHTASIDWGDGNVSKGSVHQSNGSGTVTTSHVFTASGTYHVVMTITDKDGASTTVSETVTVSPVLVETDPVYGGQMLAIGGTTAADQIDVQAARKGNQLLVALNGVTYSEPINVGRIVIYGQSGNDYIQIDKKVYNPAFVYSGPGNKTIVGGGGPDVLVGGSGNDLIVGGSSRNILIGGGGADTLVSGNADDILIASRTTYSKNDAALAAIFNEWNAGNESFSTRVHHLMNGGGLNGSYVFNSSTISSDNATDVLVGSAGSNWFLFDTGDQIIGKKRGDVLTQI